jgi:uncharacterized protein DUF1186
MNLPMQRVSRGRRWKLRLPNETKCCLCSSRRSKHTLLSDLPHGQSRRLLFFIFHLLGEWREKHAYRTLADLLRLPRREVDAIFGDGITTTSHRVMAAVFDGDPQPLYEIILDPNAEEFIRAGMCEALAIVTLQGELDRAVAGQFLRDAFTQMRPQAECYVWVGWQSAIAMLGMSDLGNSGQEDVRSGLH